MPEAALLVTPSHVVRNMVVAGLVLAAHLGALWAFQAAGAPQKEANVPVSPAPIMAQLIAPVPTPMAPAPAPLPPPVRPIPKPPAPPKPPTPKLAPKPPAIQDRTPALHAPDGALELPPPVPVPPTAPPAMQTPALQAATPDAAPAVQLPSANAAYLNNPHPVYPPISRRMNETGTVVVRAFVDEQGLPREFELKKSSGYDRLDQAALNTVRKWRFKPGTSDGSARAMWVNLPIKFELN